MRSGEQEASKRAARLMARHPPGKSSQAFNQGATALRVGQAQADRFRRAVWGDRRGDAVGRDEGRQTQRGKGADGCGLG
jgi:hypothetical protein